MTQLAIDFDSATGNPEHVKVWLWLAHMMRVEADAAEGRNVWPPVEPDYEAADACERAGERFYAKAAEVNGARITDEQWRAALVEFSG